MHYIYTDYLGSLKCVTDASGNVEQRLNYDVWGKRLNALTGAPFILPTDGVDSANFLFARGYTGHEHLDEFGLINMNGRIYDPVLGIFLSPDIAVQSPENSQSYNPYSYCMNNPLMYNDPSGYTWLSHFTGWVGEQLSSVDPTMNGTITNKGIAALIKIGSWGSTFVPSTIDFLGHGCDFSKYDPFLKGSISNNSARITMGLFTGTHQQILSRLTWELPQSVLGYGYSQFLNGIGKVDNVTFYDGATVSKCYTSLLPFTDKGLGVTFGSFIIGNNTIAADPNNPLFQHEYGHYLQSQASGWAYFPAYALPSLWGDNDSYGHKYNPVEQDANARAIQYFYNKTGGNFRWDFYENPIGYQGTGWSMSDYNTAGFQSLLNSLSISSKLFDYVRLPLFIFPAIVHSSYYSKYPVDYK